MVKMTTIMVSPQTRDQLKEVGRKNETYDHLLRKMLEAYKRQLLLQEHQRALETGEFVPFDEVWKKALRKHGKKS